MPGKLAFYQKMKYVLFFCAGIVVIFLIERYFISELRQQMKNLHNQIQFEERRLKRDLGISAKKDTHMADYEYCKPYLGTAVISDKHVFGKLLSEIERIVSDTGGSIINLSPREKLEPAGLVKKYKAEFFLEVNFGQLLTFLHKIQGSKLLIKLERSSITVKNKKSGMLQIDGIVSMVVPFAT